MVSINPRQIIGNIGDKFGLTAPDDNLYLDEYYLNGQPLDNVWTNIPNSGEADAMLCENRKPSTKPNADSLQRREYLFCQSIRSMVWGLTALHLRVIVNQISLRNMKAFRKSLSI